MSRPPPIPFFVLRAHKGEIVSLCFLTPDMNSQLCGGNGPALLSGSKNGEIFYWNFQNYRVKFTLSGHDGNSILWLGVYKNNILSQGRDGFLKIWSFKEDEWTIICTISSAELGFCTASMFVQSSCCYLIIPAKGDNSFNVVSFENGTTISNVSPPSHGICMCIKTVMHNEKIYFFCGYEDGFIVVWDYDSNSIISDAQFVKEAMFCLDVDMTCRNCGVSGFPEGCLKVWTVDGNLNLREDKTISLATPGVNVVAIRPDKKIMIAGCSDGRVHVFSWKTLKLLAVLEGHHSILCLQFSSNVISKHKSVFATGSNDCISLWSIY